MMKTTILVVILLLAQFPGYSQTFSEWFRQKATQKKYLAQQIIALEAYKGFLKKGYKIGKEGLGLIGRIKEGDFSLHRDFFGSLATASRTVQRYPRVADIISLQEKIVSSKTSTLLALDQSGLVSVSELAYCREVYGRLLSDCEKDLEQLQAITQGSELIMKDDERLKRIDGIYANTKSNYAFCRQFSAMALQLAFSRQQDKSDIATSRILNGKK